MIDYVALETRALEDVMMKALRQVAEQPEGVHILISFITSPVPMPQHLREKYPDTMAIVLENQFKILAVNEDSFEVRVFFKGVPAELVIPYSSVEKYWDNNAEYMIDLSPRPRPAEPAPTTPTAPAPLFEGEKVVSLADRRAGK